MKVSVPRYVERDCFSWVDRLTRMEQSLETGREKHDLVKSMSQARKVDAPRGPLVRVKEDGPDTVMNAVGCSGSCIGQERTLR